MDFWKKGFKKFACFGIVLLILCMLSGTAAALDAPYVSDPEIEVLQEKATHSTIYLEWNSVIDATEYRIYRSSTIQGSYIQIGTVSSNEYVNTGLLPDTYYYYMIGASDGSQNEFSNTIGIKTKALTASPTNIKAKALITNENILITWDSVNQATSYRIYRADQESGIYTEIGTSSSNSYTDNNYTFGFSDDTSYWYKVSAFTGSWGLDGGPDEAITYKRPELTAIEDGPGKIKLSWAKIESYDKPDAKDAEGYYIYRKTSSTPYEKIGTVNSGDTIEYLDTGLPDGTYTYKITAYIQPDKGKESNEETVTLSGGAQTYTVTYNANDGVFDSAVDVGSTHTGMLTGSNILEVTGINSGDKLTKPTPPPTKNGYTFQYWYDSSDVEWDFNDGIINDMTLYAKWQKNGGSNGGKDPEPPTPTEPSKPGQGHSSESMQGPKPEPLKEPELEPITQGLAAWAFPLFLLILIIIIAYLYIRHKRRQRMMKNGEL
ncbi:InlB B-repeat-containing protein [Methanimicrococcus blatticola]|uniref:Putative repeat protein (TIGR02543 family) n=1 Tax=Methanimicrococcus blatticola TaxID=91560 RepID=A0A484F644_9EURY|nr:InlB B-repeat-containing protein [Methanimicrococcus blatticola]MBZ3936283.1 InlB B-repeat-containing protein [Methanimicrococcus blatticola]MCC2508286.1 InlB B-repeat-containing protein [Methanimicrococcus blatticola]TDQ70259.1 putative repeat protein (TIGR02543 family) [Methanimicrococcus blatticola]